MSEGNKSRRSVTFLLDEKLLTLLSLCKRKGVEINEESLDETIEELGRMNDEN